MAVQILTLSNALGVEARGIDLTNGFTIEEEDILRRAISDHLVLVIRDQKLTPSQYLSAIQIFGQTMEQQLSAFLMQDYPEIAVLNSLNSEVDESGNLFPVGSRAWHTDHTNHAAPPKMTVLHAIQLPKSGGGDTGFANMQKAYDALPKTRCDELGSLQTVNKIEDKAYVSDEARKKFGALQSHPLIRTHPESGRRSIYIHPGKVAHIKNMTPHDSKEFVNELMDEVIQPEVLYRHKWEPNDIVLWDNRAVLHLAYRNYDHTEQRIMHRVLLKGDRPC
jgi:taurine dioxygenase